MLKLELGHQGDFDGVFICHPEAVYCTTCYIVVGTYEFGISESMKFVLSGPENVFFHSLKI